jgi:hypothetical protein
MQNGKANNGASYPPRGPYAPRRNGARKGNGAGNGTSDMGRIEREAAVIRALIARGVPMLAAVQKVARHIALDPWRNPGPRKTNGSP